MENRVALSLQQDYFGEHIVNNDINWENLIIPTTLDSYEQEMIYWKELENSTNKVRDTNFCKEFIPSSLIPTMWRPLEMDDVFYNDTKPTPVWPELNNSANSTAHDVAAASKHKNKFCRFCFNNKESERVYTSHYLRDSAKRITCPVLFEVVCRFCGATGTNAHTAKYCPQKL